MSRHSPHFGLNGTPSDRTAPKHSVCLTQLGPWHQHPVGMWLCLLPQHCFTQALQGLPLWLPNHLRMARASLPRTKSSQGITPMSCGCRWSLRLFHRAAAGSSLCSVSFCVFTSLFFGFPPLPEPGWLLRIGEEV